MQTFNEIVTSILHIDAVAVGDTASPEDIPDWDSMNYLLFIAELEKQYNTSFTMDEVLGAKNLGDVKQLLKKRGVDL